MSTNKYANQNRNKNKGKKPIFADKGPQNNKNQQGSDSKISAATQVLLGNETAQIDKKGQANDYEESKEDLTKTAETTTTNQEQDCLTSSHDQLASEVNVEEFNINGNSSVVQAVQPEEEKSSPDTSDQKQSDSTENSQSKIPLLNNLENKEDVSPTKQLIKLNVEQNTPTQAELPEQTALQVQVEETNQKVQFVEQAVQNTEIAVQNFDESQLADNKLEDELEESKQQTSIEIAELSSHQNQTTLDEEANEIKDQSKIPAQNLNQSHDADVNELQSLGTHQVVTVTHKVQEFQDVQSVALAKTAETTTTNQEQDDLPKSHDQPASEQVSVVESNQKNINALEVQALQPEEEKSSHDTDDFKQPDLSENYLSNKQPQFVQAENNEHASPKEEIKETSEQKTLIKAELLDETTIQQQSQENEQKSLFLQELAQSTNDAVSNSEEQQLTDSKLEEESKESKQQTTNFNDELSSNQTEKIIDEGVSNITNEINQTVQKENESHGDEVNELQDQETHDVIITVQKHQELKDAETVLLAKTAETAETQQEQHDLPQSQDHPDSEQQSAEELNQPSFNAPEVLVVQPEEEKQSHDTDDQEQPDSNSNFQTKIISPSNNHTDNDKVGPQEEMKETAEQKTLDKSDQLDPSEIQHHDQENDLKAQTMQETIQITEVVQSNPEEQKLKDDELEGQQQLSEQSLSLLDQQATPSQQTVSTLDKEGSINNEQQETAQQLEDQLSQTKKSTQSLQPIQQQKQNETQETKNSTQNEIEHQIPKVPVKQQMDRQEVAAETEQSNSSQDSEAVASRQKQMHEAEAESQNDRQDQAQVFQEKEAKEAAAAAKSLKDSQVADHAEEQKQKDLEESAEVIQEKERQEAATAAKTLKESQVTEAVSQEKRSIQHAEEQKQKDLEEPAEVKIDEVRQETSTTTKKLKDSQDAEASQKQEKSVQDAEAQKQKDLEDSFQALQEKESQEAVIAAKLLQDSYDAESEAQKQNNLEDSYKVLQEKDIQQAAIAAQTLKDSQVAEAAAKEERSIEEAEAQKQKDLEDSNQVLQEQEQQVAATSLKQERLNQEAESASQEERSIQHAEQLKQKDLEEPVEVIQEKERQDAANAAKKLKDSFDAEAVSQEKKSIQQAEEQKQKDLEEPAEVIQEKERQETVTTAQKLKDSLDAEAAAQQEKLFQEDVAQKQKVFEDSTKVLQEQEGQEAATLVKQERSNQDAVAQRQQDLQEQADVKQEKENQEEKAEACVEAINQTSKTTMIDEKSNDQAGQSHSVEAQIFTHQCQTVNKSFQNQEEEVNGCQDDSIAQNLPFYSTIEKVESSLFQRIGGENAVNAAVDQFYTKVLADDRVKSFFTETDMSKQKKMQKQFLTFAFGGETKWNGRSLKAAHKNLVEKQSLNDMHFDAIAELLSATLEDLKVEQSLIDEVMQVVGQTRNDVLNRPEQTTHRETEETKTVQIDPLNDNDVLDNQSAVQNEVQQPVSQEQETSAVEQSDQIKEELIKLKMEKDTLIVQLSEVEQKNQQVEAEKMKLENQLVKLTELEQKNQQVEAEKYELENQLAFLTEVEQKNKQVEAEKQELEDQLQKVTSDNRAKILEVSQKVSRLNNLVGEFMQGSSNFEMVDTDEKDLNIQEDLLVQVFRDLSEANREKNAEVERTKKLLAEVEEKLKTEQEKQTAKLLQQKLEESIKKKFELEKEKEQMQEHLKETQNQLYLLESKDKLIQLQELKLKDNQNQLLKQSGEIEARTVALNLKENEVNDRQNNYEKKVMDKMTVQHFVNKKEVLEARNKLSDEQTIFKREQEKLKAEKTELERIVRDQQVEKRNLEKEQIKLSFEFQMLDAQKKEFNKASAAANAYPKEIIGVITVLLLVIGILASQLIR